MNLSAAHAIAERVTRAVISDPELLSGLIQSSGVGPDELREMLDRPELHDFVMPFATEHDPRLLDLAAQTGIAPQDIAQAAALLAGPGHHSWSAD
ncbi:MAG: DUF3572 family protein [Paracoccus sp. (in: a-proteobacteria)]|nr:DUF3572 family protein [Paracoccus sp. (in: a-proteobacteria)]